MTAADLPGAKPTPVAAAINALVRRVGVGAAADLATKLEADGQGDAADAILLSIAYVERVDGGGA